MGVSPQTTPKKCAAGYDYRLDPLHPRNRHAARLLGWRYDPDFHDYVDDKGLRLGGGYHIPVNNTAYTPR